MGEMNQETLGIEEISLIIKLFENKGWNIDQSNVFSLYNRFKATYKFLNIEERQLFIELSYMYNIVTLNEYQTYIIDILKTIYLNDKFSFKSEKDVYIMPLLSESESGQIKSSTLVSYLFNSTDLFYDDMLAKKSFHIIDNYEMLKKKVVNINNKKTLILVDDFIGSGRTAVKAIDDILNKGISSQNIIVLGLIVHKMGKELIQKKGIPVFCKQIIGKELSSKQDLKDKIEIMQGIERKLNVNEEYNLGYMRTEALISLIRTPNNTLPLFWYKGKQRKNQAPFPRKK